MGCPALRWTSMHDRPSWCDDIISSSKSEIEPFVWRGCDVFTIFWTLRLDYWKNMEKVLSGIGMINPVRPLLSTVSVGQCRWLPLSHLNNLQVKRNSCILRLDRKLLLMDKTNFSKLLRIWDVLGSIVIFRSSRKFLIIIIITANIFILLLLFSLLKNYCQIGIVL